MCNASATFRCILQITICPDLHEKNVHHVSLLVHFKALCLYEFSDAIDIENSSYSHVINNTKKSCSKIFIHLPGFQAKKAPKIASKISTAQVTIGVILRQFLYFLLNPSEYVLNRSNRVCEGRSATFLSRRRSYNKFFLLNNNKNYY